MNTYPTSKAKQIRQVDRRVANQYRIQTAFSVYISRLAEFREDLDITREIFAQGRIWPDQCNYIISTFEPIRRTASNLAESFRSKKQRTKSLGRIRYSILANAYHFHDQLDKTISFIREFGATTQQWPGKKSKIKEIQNALCQLDSSFNDLMKGLDSIKEETA